MVNAPRRKQQTGLLKSIVHFAGSFGSSKQSPDEEKEPFVAPTAGDVFAPSARSNELLHATAWKCMHVANCVLSKGTCDDVLSVHAYIDSLSMRVPLSLHFDDHKTLFGRIMVAALREDGELPPVTTQGVDAEEYGSESGLSWALPVSFCSCSLDMAASPHHLKTMILS
jgi:hypothetical protein